MSDFMQKARQGRIAALSNMAPKSSTNASDMGLGVRFRSANRHENVVFMSSRAGRQSVLMLG